MARHRFRHKVIPILGWAQTAYRPGMWHAWRLADIRPDAVCTSSLGKSGEFIEAGKIPADAKICPTCLTRVALQDPGILNILGEI